MSVLTFKLVEGGGFSGKPATDLLLRGRCILSRVTERPGCGGGGPRCKSIDFCKWREFSRHSNLEKARPSFEAGRGSRRAGSSFFGDRDGSAGASPYQNACTRIERFKKYCSRSGHGIRERSFWVVASFRLSHRPLRACSLTKASPKPKNPRSERPHYFLRRSWVDKQGRINAKG